MNSISHAAYMALMAELSAAGSLMHAVSCTIFGQAAYETLEVAETGVLDRLRLLQAQGILSAMVRGVCPADSPVLAQLFATESSNEAGLVIMRRRHARSLKFIIAEQFREIPNAVKYHVKNHIRDLLWIGPVGCRFDNVRHASFTPRSRYP